MSKPFPERAHHPAIGRCRADRRTSTVFRSGLAYLFPLWKSSRSIWAGCACTAHRQAFLPAQMAYGRWPLRSVLRDLVGLPAFAVGPTTAHLMKQAGFIDVRQGEGNATALTALIRKETNAAMGRLFYFAGRVHSPAMAAELTSAGFAVETIIAYDAVPSQTGMDALSAHLNSYPHAEEAVLLYSPRAATIFSDTVLSGQLGSALNSRWAFGLSDAVRQPITNLPFKRSLVSSDQNERALFSLIESYL